MLIGLTVGLAPTGVPSPNSRSYALGLPAMPAFAGAELFGQGLVVDPFANALGVIVSNAVDVLLGTH